MFAAFDRGVSLNRPQLYEQATPLLRPEIHNQLIKPLRRRGKIPCQALYTQVLRRLPPDELAIKRYLITL